MLRRSLLYPATDMLSENDGNRVLAQRHWGGKLNVTIYKRCRYDNAWLKMHIY
jgi:hypothetical protein